MAATKFRFPQGTARAWLLRFRRADGAPRDLTEASFAAYIKASGFDADAAALVDVSARLSVYDPLAGLALLSLTSADTADLDSFAAKELQIRATLADGTIVAHEEHGGPLVFTPLSGDPDISEPPNDYIEAITDMSSFVRVLENLVGLTGGQSTKLDGLSAAALAAMSAGQQVELFFDGSIAARYRLRGRNQGETEYAGNAGDATHPGGSLILCDLDGDLCWELIAVTKNGLPCTWDGDSLTWRQVLSTAGAPSLADEADGFSLPT